MAKDKFERTKPHVNVGTIGHQVGRLQQAVRGTPTLETLADVLAACLSGNARGTQPSSPANESELFMGSSTVEVDGTSRAAIVRELGLLKDLLADEPTLWSLVVLMEAIVIGLQPTVQRQLPHALQTLTGEAGHGYYRPLSLRKVVDTASVQYRNQLRFGS